MSVGDDPRPDPGNPPATQALFELGHVSRSFAGEEILGIDRLSLPQGHRAGGRVGEVLTFVGPNGSGKSTLLYLLALLDLPNPDSEAATSVRVFGREMQGATLSDRDRLRWQTMGIAFQNTCLLPYMTVEQNIAMPVWTRNGAQDQEFLRQLVDALGLRKVAPSRIDKLSSGQRRRVALARSMVTRPRVLILDEPTESLDRPGIQWLRQFLLGEEEPGGYSPETVLLITHDLGFAATVGTRFYGIRDHRVHPVLFEEGATKDSRVDQLLRFLDPESAPPREEEAEGEPDQADTTILEGGGEPSQSNTTEGLLPAAGAAIGNEGTEEDQGAERPGSKPSQNEGMSSLRALWLYSWSSTFHGSRNRYSALVQIVALAIMFLTSVGLLKIMVASAAHRYGRLVDPLLNRLEVVKPTGEVHEFTADDVERLASLQIEKAPRLTPLSAFVTQETVRSERITYPRTVRGSAGVRTIFPDLQFGQEGFVLRGLTYRLDDLVLETLQVVGLAQKNTAGRFVLESSMAGWSVARLLSQGFEDDSRAAGGYGLVVISRRVAQRVFGEDLGGQGRDGIVTLAGGPAEPVEVRTIVVERLPGGYECLVQEEFYLRELFRDSSLDSMPGYASINVYLNSLFEAPSVIEAIDGENASSPRRRFEPLDDISQRLAGEELELKVLGVTVLGGFATIVLLTMLSLAVIFSQRVRNRAREIGVLRSVGASTRWIFMAFSLEGFWIWLVSTGFGLAVLVLSQAPVDRWAVQLVAQSAEEIEEVLPMMSLPAWAVPGLLLMSLAMVFAGSIAAWRLGSSSDIASYLRGEAQ